MLFIVSESLIQLIFCSPFVLETTAHQIGIHVKSFMGLHRQKRSQLGKSIDLRILEMNMFVINPFSNEFTS